MYSFYRKFFFVDDSHVCDTPCPHCRHEGEDDFQDSLEDELDTFGVKNYTEGFDEGRKKGFREGKTEGKSWNTHIPLAILALSPTVLATKPTNHISLLSQFIFLLVAEPTTVS